MDAKIAISIGEARARRREQMFFVLNGCKRTIKYEEVYLRAYRSVSEARRGLDTLSWQFYNQSAASAFLTLAGKRPIRHISPSQRQARRRHNQSGEPLIDSLQTVQGNRATSVDAAPRNIILTTHSPNIASVAPLKNIVVLRLRSDTKGNPSYSYCWAFSSSYRPESEGD